MSDKDAPPQSEPDSPRTGDVADPIEFLYRDHARLQACCDDLGRLADDPGADDGPALAASILDFMENDLPLHLADEEEDLFPLLKWRSPPDDKIIPMIDLLVIEHRDDVEYGRALLPALRLLSTGQRPDDAALFGHHVRAFRMLQRRHQAMENNVLLPAAFERLSDLDKERIAGKMAARRGATASKTAKGAAGGRRRAAKPGAKKA